MRSGDRAASIDDVRRIAYAAVTSAVERAYPVGSIYLSAVATDPATLLGFGTWAALGAGRTLVGYASGDPDFGTLLGTAGSKTAAPTGSTSTAAAHTHTYTEVPNHTHPIASTSTDHEHKLDVLSGATGSPGDAALQGVGEGADGIVNSQSAATGSPSATNNPTGGVAFGTTASSGSHSHTAGTLSTTVIQPSLVVRIWQRTA